MDRERGFSYVNAYTEVDKEKRMLNPDATNARPGSNERQPDVRDIVEYADTIGELARIDGADWDLEIGVLAEIFAHSNPGRSPAVLFDKIKGYPAGMRIVSGLHNTCRRLAYRLRLSRQRRSDDDREGLSRPHEGRASS